jgi:hypothetical protein
MPFGRSKPQPSPDPGPGMLDNGKHWQYVMNADGSRSSTKIPCACAQGAEHDGPVPDPSYQAK